MPTIHTPHTGRQVNFDTVTKLQLALACNEMTDIINNQKAQIKAMAQVLLAIGQEPESFKYADGRVTVEKTALDKVKKGTNFKLEFTDTEVVIHVLPPDLTAPTIERAPMFVLPN